jgi:hypothetical protein
MKLHFPQEFSEMKNRDVPSTPNDVDASNNGSQTQPGTFKVETEVINGKSNQFTGNHNNRGRKEKNSMNSNSKRSEFLLTNCSEFTCSTHKINKAEQFRCTCSVLHDSRKCRPPARKGTQDPFMLRDTSVRNCADQYANSKRGKDNYPDFSVTCERDNGNQVTSVSNAESALEGASNYSMSIDCDITAIVKEVKVLSPVSNLDDSFSDNSDMVENIPSGELDFCVLSEDVRTEVQKAADINSCNKDSTQFTSDARGTLTPCAALEDGTSIAYPTTKETYELETAFPISNLNDPCSEMSDIIEIIPSFELDYSIMLKDVKSEIQKAADINNHNKDSTQFILDTTGTLTPFAFHENGPSIVCPRTKEIYKLKTVSAINSLDDHCSEMPDMIENTPSSELGYSILLEDLITEIQKEADVNNDNKDSTQFLSDITGTLTPFAACMDGPSSMFLNTKEN